MYAGRHIISLLSHANAQDLDLGDPADIDLATALAKAKDDRLKAVSDAINSAAGTAGTDADNDSSSALVTVIPKLWLHGLRTRLRIRTPLRRQKKFLCTCRSRSTAWAPTNSCPSP